MDATTQTVVQLPLWVEYVKALGAPAVALVAAVIAGGIAYRQWKTARNKLKLDLFAKRIEVYEAAVELITEMSNPEPAEWSKIHEISKRMSAAHWLFSPGIENYLHQFTNQAFYRLHLERFTDRPSNVRSTDDVLMATDDGEVTTASVDEHIQALVLDLATEREKLNKLMAPYLALEH